MASTSRNASSSMGITGSTIVHSPTAATAATELDEDRDHDSFPADMNNRYSTALEQSVSRPPSAQPRRSTNVSRMGTSRMESPISDVNYPSWLPRRPLAPGPGSTTDNGHGGGRLADLFSFSRGHSRNVTSSTNRMSYDVSGHVSPSSERKPTDGSVGPSAYPGANRRGRATPRSVRIATGSGSYGIHEHRQQETTEQTRRPSSSYSYGHHHGYGHGYGHTRGLSRTTGNPYAGMLSQSPLGLEPPDLLPQPMPAPRFNARNLNLSLLRSPSRFIRLRYLLQPVTYFAHVPAQLFFDFNVVYILTQYVSPLFRTPVQAC
jgi:hypothetical protein